MFHGETLFFGIKLLIDLSSQLFVCASIGIHALTSNTDLGILRPLLVSRIAVVPKQKSNNCTVIAKINMCFFDATNPCKCNYVNSFVFLLLHKIM